MNSPTFMHSLNAVFRRRSNSSLSDVNGANDRRYVNILLEFYFCTNCVNSSNFSTSINRSIASCSWLCSMNCGMIFSTNFKRSSAPPYSIILMLYSFPISDARWDRYSCPHAMNSSRVPSWRYFRASLSCP